MKRRLWSLCLLSALGALTLALLVPNAFARKAYVIYNGPKSEGLSVLDTQANQLVGSPIPAGEFPGGVAIAPNGKTAYVTSGSLLENSVLVLDTQTNEVVGSPITVGTNPTAIAITPDGKTAYVVNFESNSVSVIDTRTNKVVGSPIAVEEAPEAIAITPDGKTAYVTSLGTKNNVSVIDTQTNKVVGSPIPVGEFPGAIAITPDGKTAYVTNGGSSSLSMIDTQTNQVMGVPIPVKKEPEAIAITPDQPPHASFSAPRARPGVPLHFDASASSDPDGSIANYGWAFGDGQTAATGGSRQSHSFSTPGTYQVTLKLTDNEGCSGALLFTGQTAYCNRSALASQTKAIKVAYPGVRLKCPRNAKPFSCRFTLQAVTKRRKGKAESASARAKLKPGHSAIVSLKPKAAFRVKLAGAKKVLVKETVRIAGSKRTRFGALKIVQ